MVAMGRKKFVSFASSASFLVLSLLLLIAAGCAEAQTEECINPINRIIAENCQAGSPATEWDINGAGDPDIQGFGTDMSVNIGEPIDFKIKTLSDNYRLDIYRAGYYGGLGARLMSTIRPSVPLPQHQPECYHEKETLLFDCANWFISASWEVPLDATSGLYFARLVREDTIPPSVLGASWKTDYCTQVPDPKFSKPGPDEKPKPDPHAYGAQGFGKLRNKLREPRASHIYFVVRNDSSLSEAVFQTADTTWQAYNRYGGTSMYGSYDPGRPMKRLYKGSYNRPFATRDYRGTNMFFGSEYPAVRFFEKNGYDLTYISGMDTERSGHLLLNHKLFLSVGHDEYWSGPQRKNVEKARDSGVNLAFLSGNEMFWKVRWEPTPHLVLQMQLPGSSNPRTKHNESRHRVMVCYKESQEHVKIDPDTYTWTGTFRDSRPINPEGGNPENSVTGTIFTVNAWRHDPLVIPSAYRHLKFWKNTSVSSLQRGQKRVLQPGILGHEWDEDMDNGHRPAGLIHLSETTVDNVFYIQDHGSVYDTGTGTHRLTMYRASSGATVFGAGTVQWAWGLDENHDIPNGVIAQIANANDIRVGVDLIGASRDIQQFTVNVFAHMGIIPHSMQSDLAAPSLHKDTAPPACSFSLLQLSPVDPTLHYPVTATPPFIVPHSKVYFRAEITSVDFEGGVTAAVEVRYRPYEMSTEDSSSSETTHGWHPAYRIDDDGLVWGFHAPGPHEDGHGPAAYMFECRAVDDSLNMQHVLSRQVFVVPPPTHEESLSGKDTEAL